MSADLWREAEAAGAADPIARHELAYLTPEIVAGAATWRAGVEANRLRLGMTRAEFLDIIDPIPPRTWPIVGPSSDLAPELEPAPSHLGQSHSVFGARHFQVPVAPAGAGFVFLRESFAKPGH